MDDGRLLAVEVAQGQSNIVKDGVALSVGKDSSLTDTGLQVGVQILHHQYGYLLRSREKYAQKLDNIWVSDLCQKSTLLLEPADNVGGRALL